MHELEGFRTFYKLTTKLGKAEAIFRVQTELKGEVYMSMRRENSSVVIEVDAGRLVSFWCEEPSEHHSFARGGREAWCREKCFDNAANNFSIGEGSPVGLADFGIKSDSRRRPTYRRSILGIKLKTGFELVYEIGLRPGNGIHRTAWLLYQGAKVFTIKCDKKSAGELLARVGADGARIISMDELFGCNVC